MKMAIKDLQARQGNVDLIVEISEKGDIREFEKFGKQGRVCNCKVKDETGEISLTLWNEDINLVNVGDKVHIQNGWVNEWQGELQLSTGKFGKMEVISKDKAETVDEAVEEEIIDNPPQTDVGEHILTDDEKMETEVLEKLDKNDVEEMKEEKSVTIEDVSSDEIVEEKIADEPGDEEKEEMQKSEMTEDEKNNIE